MKYNDTHTIYLLGDLNGSITRPEPTCRDRMLRNFCQEMDLCISVPVCDTFFHVNGRDSAQSDYILTMNKDSKSMKNYRVLELTTNTSDHIPVHVNIDWDKVPSTTANNETHQSTDTVKPKTRWDRIDLSRYKDLTDVPLDMDSIGSPSQLITTINNINDHLSNAAEGSQLVPCRKRKKSKKGLNIWNPEIARCIKKSKECLFRWRSAGSPRIRTHPLCIDRKYAKAKLRAEIRRAMNNIREKQYTEIMNARSDNTKLFFKLIQMQRATKSTATELLIANGKNYTHSDIPRGFASYFTDLAIPKSNESFDQSYKDSTSLCTAIQDVICRNNNDTINPISINETRHIISSFKNGKAADSSNITAEHFKYAGMGIIKAVADVINFMLRTKFVPAELTQGTLTPVLKKGKDATVADNYRGITVTPLFSKILEKAWLLRATPILSSNQNLLQRGFTKGVAPLNAALLVTESINEAIDCKSPLYITFLDASKAFDVVDHEILLDELYSSGIDGSLWVLLRELYREPTTRVKWNNIISEEFNVLQGVRQGGVSSAPVYKSYTNRLLNNLQKHHLGHRIGTVNVSAPTCADDIAILSNSHHDSQAAINIVDDYAASHRYTINASKSATVAFNSFINVPLEIGNCEIPYAETAVHLGISRQSSNSNNIDERIQAARRTTYALMGAGMHGRNGLAPYVTQQLLSTYVIPRLIYGLEVTKLKTTEITKLENFQRKMLRQLQFLPDSPSPSNAAIYGLLGVKPVTASMDTASLLLLGKIAGSPGSLEYEIACRQLAVKNFKSKSWFMYCRSLTNKYDLPSIYDLMRDPPTYSNWKHKVTEAVNNYWSTDMRTDAAGKSSLRFLNSSSFTIGQVHPLWKTLSSNPREVVKAAIKARVLTGTYVLQANRAKFNQFEVDPTCQLCKSGPEDRLHFILHCQALDDVRQKYLLKLKNRLHNYYSSNEIDTIYQADNILLQIILDPTHPDLQCISCTPPVAELTWEIEPVTRSLCYSLHSKRSALMK